MVSSIAAPGSLLPGALVRESLTGSTDNEN